MPCSACRCHLPGIAAGGASLSAVSNLCEFGISHCGSAGIPGLAAGTSGKQKAAAKQEGGCGSCAALPSALGQGARLHLAWKEGMC